MALGHRPGKRHPPQAREFRPKNTAAPNQQRRHPVTWNGATGVLARRHLLRTQRSPRLASKERKRTWGTRRLFLAAQVREILQGFAIAVKHRDCQRMRRMKVAPASC